MTPIEKINKLATYNTIPFVIDKLEEELIEALEAVKKWSKGKDDLNHVVEELTDVQIMTKQLFIKYGINNENELQKKADKGLSQCV